jgi:hypothetical protein
MNARWLSAFLLVPVAYTAAILLLAASNRTTGRVPIVLTHREAVAPVRNEDRTATQLRLTWQSPPPSPDGWFTREMLATLGFDVGLDPAAPGAERHYARLLPREVFIAFELDGPAWQQLAGRAGSAAGPAPPPGRDREFEQHASRLVPVDAALDAGTLAARYPDGRTHLITEAVVRARWVRAVGSGTPYLHGDLMNIEPNQVNVPRDLARQLPLRDRFDGTQIPYTVSIRYGSRWEPVVVDVSPAGASR